MQQKARPGDTAATDDSFEEAQRSFRTCIPDFFLPPCWSCEGKEDRGEVIPSLLMNLLHKLPDLVSAVYLVARAETQTEQLAVLYSGLA